MMQISQHKTQSASRAARLRFALQMAEQTQNVGARISQEREVRGWSRPQLARELPGVTTGNDVYRWETGKHMPRSDTLDAIASLFGITVADLYAGPVTDQSEEKAEESIPADGFSGATEGSGAAEVDQLLLRVDAMENQLTAELATVKDALKEQRLLLETVLRNQEAGPR